MCCEGALKPRQEAYKWTEGKRTLRRGGKAVQLSWARNNLSELQTINLTLRFNSISIVTSAFGRSLSMSLRVSTSHPCALLAMRSQAAHRINDALAGNCDCDCDCNPFGHVLLVFSSSHAGTEFGVGAGAGHVCDRVMREGRQRSSISTRAVAKN